MNYNQILRMALTAFQAMQSQEKDGIGMHESFEGAVLKPGSNHLWLLVGSSQLGSHIKELELHEQGITITLPDNLKNLAITRIIRQEGFYICLDPCDQELWRRAEPQGPHNAETYLRILLNETIAHGKEIARKLGATFYKVTVLPDGSAVVTMKKEGKRFEYPIEGNFQTIVSFVHYRAKARFGKTWWINIRSRRDPSFGDDTDQLRYFRKERPDSMHDYSAQDAA